MAQRSAQGILMQELPASTGAGRRVSISFREVDSGASSDAASSNMSRTSLSWKQYLQIIDVRTEPEGDNEDRPGRGRHTGIDDFEAAESESLLTREGFVGNSRP